VKKEYALDIRGRSFALDRKTRIMGILNVTPDSFADGGAYLEAEAAIARGLEMVEEGADIIDIGGESTRPGSLPVPEEEELRRVVPVVRELRKRTEILLSIDTSKAGVARRTADLGIDLINDTSPIALMHMAGTPETMQIDPRYDDVLEEIRAFLGERVRTAKDSGVSANRILVDPGIGFGKTAGHNLALIANLDVFADLGCPILLGVSRKSFIGKVLDLPVEERLEASLAAGVLGIARGAHILRVHDVKAMRRAADMADAVLAASEASREKGFRACRPC
jgi:dihydropteroate synthase